MVLMGLTNMKTKYGYIPEESVISYLERLKGKVYKILPMKEEKCPTLDEYISNLIRELVSTSEVIESLKYEGDLLSLISTLDGLIGQEDFKAFRSDVLKSMTIIKKMVGVKGGR
jgi:hypothetical protein